MLLCGRGRSLPAELQVLGLGISQWGLLWLHVTSLPTMDTRHTLGSARLYIPFHVSGWCFFPIKALTFKHICLG